MGMTEKGARSAAKTAQKLAAKAKAFWAADARTTIEGDARNGWRILRARPDGRPQSLATLPSRALASVVKSALMKAEKKHGRDTSEAYTVARSDLRALSEKNPKRYGETLDDTLN